MSGKPLEKLSPQPSHVQGSCLTSEIDHPHAKGWAMLNKKVNSLDGVSCDREMDFQQNIWSSYSQMRQLHHQVAETLVVMTTRSLA